MSITQPIIPNLPASEFLRKDEKGSYSVHPDWMGVLRQLTIALQTNISNEGFKMPQQNSTNVTSLNTPKSIGSIVYNNETHAFMGNVNGVFKTFTTS